MTRSRELAKILTDGNLTGTLDVVGETTLQTHLNMGDNDKIKLGAGGDLQLSHSGTNSVIDNNTGGLYIRNNVASDVGGDIFIQAKSGENSATFTHDGAVTLMHDNATKFATTSTGATVSSSADVTMNITAGGTSNDSLINFVHGSTTDGGITYDHNGAYASEKMVFRTGNNTPHMYLDGNGKLGIGIASPDGKVHIHTATAGSVTANTDADELVVENSGHAGISVLAPDANRSAIVFGHASDNHKMQIRHDGSTTLSQIISDDPLTFNVNGGTERMRINSSGLVGIGTTAPTSPLHVVSGEIGNGSNKGIKIANHNASKAYSIRTGITGSENTSLSIHDDTAGVSRITIDTSGRVGIGASNMGSYQANNDDLLIATSGSTGITIRSGSADQGRIAFADGTGDLTEEMRGLLMYNHNGNAMSFFTNSAERMRITSAGLVNIGSTNPYSMLDVTNNTNANTTITASAQITTANHYHEIALGNREAYAVGIRRTLTQSTPAYLRPRMDFFVQGYNTYLPADRTVAMTILDSKQVSIGVTSTLGNARVAIDADNLIYCLICKANASNGAFILFQKDDGSTIGNIDHTASATRYVTSSDYRLKENVSYDFDATSRLKQLKPARFNFIADETDTLVDGFLAHEVSSIVPEAIRGEKDAVDEDGNIDPQGIDQSKLVPLLVKAMQEQQATIEALTARITALEGS